MIISASRRTDIPAFYADWLLNRLQQGYVIVANPFNPKQVSKILLTPQTVDCIVFWTKNPEPLMPKLDAIDRLGYKYYFEFTVNNYGKAVEQNLPNIEQLVDTFHNLAGRAVVNWRYDPIIISDKFDLAFHLENFAYLAKNLSGYTNRCIIGFIDVYAKIKKLAFSEPAPEIQQQIIQGLVKIAEKHNIQLLACSEELDFTSHGVGTAACIDKAVVEKVLACGIKAKKHAGQRKLCNCIQSIDIGMYNTCAHACVYCYANQNIASATQTQLEHDPTLPCLGASVQLGKAKEKQLLSLKELAQQLF